MRVIFAFGALRKTSDFFIFWQGYKMDDLLTSYVRLLMNAVNKQKNLPAWELKYSSWPTSVPNYL